MYQQMAATPGARVALTGWNAYSRIDAVTGFKSPYLARLYIDSDAWTNILAWDGTVDSVARMKRWYRRCRSRSCRRAEDVDHRPGRRVGRARRDRGGFAEGDAVEMNPLMLRFVRRFGASAGNLYDHPMVETILSEGRNFIRRSDRAFDVILLGFVDSWAAVASGGLALSENHLYTVEAFQAYVDHLTPDGALLSCAGTSISPGSFRTPLRSWVWPEAGKRIAVFVESRPSGQFDPSQMIFMFKKRPFTEQETAQMAAWIQRSPSSFPDATSKNRTPRSSRGGRVSRTTWLRRPRRWTPCSTTGRSSSRGRSLGAFRPT